MHASFPSQNNPFIQKIDSVFALTKAERQVLAKLPMELALIEENQDIVREGDRPSRCCLLLSGFTATYKITTGGKRQIVTFGIAGDVPDLQSLHLPVLDSSVRTLTTCQVGFITHDDLRDLCTRYPRITAAFWRETLIEGAVFREWVMNVGRREAHSRMAHVLCELLVRMRAVGLVEGHSCELPITQVEFADAMGITPVHVNRVLQQMRADGLIEIRGTQLTVPDWDKLKQMGEFDPTYLHLENPDQVAA